MNYLKAFAAIATVTTPLIALADPPSGQFDTDFPLDRTSTQPQFPRAEFELYVEHWLPDGRSTTFIAKSREQVEAELANAPGELIGA